MKLPAADAAFVGRDAKELRGAKSQGLATIALNADADAHADVHLRRFEELLGITRFSPAHRPPHERKTALTLLPDLGIIRRACLAVFRPNSVH